MWEKLNIGYIQGMCDLCAPLLVIMDDGKYLCYLSFYPIIPGGYKSTPNLALRFLAKYKERTDELLKYMVCNSVKTFQLIPIFNTS